MTLERLLIVDLITTGLDPAHGQIVESAGILLGLAHAEVIEARSIVVHAEIEPGTEIGGFSDDFLRSLPGNLVRPEDGLDEQPAIELLFALAKRADAFVAHGAARVQAWLPVSLTRQLPWVCTRFGCDWPNGSYGDDLGMLVAMDVEGRSLHRCLAIAELMKEVRLDELSLHAPDLRTILERGLARGVGLPPRCEHGRDHEIGEEPCEGYVRTFLRADAIMGKRRCPEHGGSWQWIL